MSMNEPEINLAADGSSSIYSSVAIAATTPATSSIIIEPEINLSNAVPFATATPVLSSQVSPSLPAAAYNVSSILNREQINILKSHGFPSGLAQELGNTRATFPLRFWVVDNSGSMRTSDGHQIRGSQDNIKVVECNRWTELQEVVCNHAELAGLIEATTVFRLLNAPSIKVGPQEFSVAETTSQSIQADVERAKSIIMAAEPKGVTPLTEHLIVIRSRIQAVEHVLRNEGQQAVIVLATDGLPSNDRGESTQEGNDQFIDALRSLQSLPVWVVVRLCTDNNSVVEFYNNLDQMLELPLEVIDDFIGEGEEVHKANRWLNYALPLHRCREMGYHHRVFDLLDERLLNKDELRSFLDLLFGKTALESAPDPQVDWKGFVKVLKRVVSAEGRLYNPNTRRLDFWVDFKQLEKAYGKKGFRLFG